eukprot:1160676-Pelagomonas_calceolata.AAC.3
MERRTWVWNLNLQHDGIGGRRSRSSMAKTQTRKHAEYKASPAHLAAFTAHVAILADTANASTTPALKALAAELHQGLTCGSLDINQLTKVFLTGVEQVSAVSVVRRQGSGHGPGSENCFSQLQTLTGIGLCVGCKQPVHDTATS